MKYWEIIADNLSKAGWSWGCISTLDLGGQTIFVADAHRGDGKRFVVRADEKLTAFVELESDSPLWRPGLTSGSNFSKLGVAKQIWRGMDARERETINNPLKGYWK